MNLGKKVVTAVIVYLLVLAAVFGVALYFLTGADLEVTHARKDFGYQKRFEMLADYSDRRATGFFAKLGSLSAQKKLCFMDEHPWCRKAAENGDKESAKWVDESNRLDGTVFEFGNAIKWLRDQAQEGDTKAQASLGMMYYTGYAFAGIPQSDADSYFWLSLALKNGTSPYDDSYAYWRDDAAKHLSVEKKTEVEKRITGWKLGPLPPSCDTPQDCQRSDKIICRPYHPACVDHLCRCGL